MKMLWIALLLSAPAVADDASLSGKWQVYRSAGGNESQQDCTFTQKDSELTGTCNTPDRAPVQISGKVEGKNVSWTYKTDSPGGPVTVVHTGTIESPGKITGTLVAVEFSVEGQFTATRAK